MLKLINVHYLNLLILSPKNRCILLPLDSISYSSLLFSCYVTVKLTLVLRFLPSNPAVFDTALGGFGGFDGARFPNQSTPVRMHIVR